MTGWVSVMGDKFNCDTCKRRKGNFLCPLNGHLDKDIIQKRMDNTVTPNSMPLIFKAESAGVCPKALISPFAQMVAKSYRWWEKSQLGINYTDAPIWVDQAFTIYANSLGRARQFASKQRQSDRGK